MEQETELSHETLSKILVRGNSDTYASEAHGMLCGMLAVVGYVELEKWFGHVLGEFDPDDLSVTEAKVVLRMLHDQVKDQMAGGEFDLQLLLPSDEVELEDRVDDLTEWCQGFLYGMTAAGVSDLDNLPGEVGEIVQDILDISKAAYDPGEGEDEGESAYMEVVEYIRVGAMLIYSEFNRNASQDEQPTIH